MIYDNYIHDMGKVGTGIMLHRSGDYSQVYGEYLVSKRMMM